MKMAASTAREERDKSKFPLNTWWKFSDVPFGPVTYVLHIGAEITVYARKSGPWGNRTPLHSELESLSLEKFEELKASGQLCPIDGGPA